MEPRWLEWGRALQIIAQNGLAYCTNPFDIQRYEAIRRVAAEILAGGAMVEPGELEALFTGQEGYATPKVDVRGAVFQDNAILLVSELLDQGRWTLPGGWADQGDSPSEAVKREIEEESGYQVRVTKLAAVYDRNRRGHPYSYFSTYKLFFLCELAGGAPANSIETGGAAFYKENELPELSISRVTPDEIHMLFNHHRQPDLPTEFD